MGGRGILVGWIGGSPGGCRHTGRQLGFGESIRRGVRRSRISQFLSSHYTEDDILIISSNQFIQEIGERLTKQNIPHYIGEPDQDGFIALVDFQNAKGLEREIVFVVGIEDLYERTSPDGMFWEEGKKLRMESFSRRMIYVAMTRTIEQLIIYYSKPDNRFITELINRNNQILSKVATG